MPVPTASRVPIANSPRDHAKHNHAEAEKLPLIKSPTGPRRGNVTGARAQKAAQGAPARRAGGGYHRPRQDVVTASTVKDRQPKATGQHKAVKPRDAHVHRTNTEVSWDVPKGSKYTRQTDIPSSRSPTKTAQRPGPVRSGQGQQQREKVHRNPAARAGAQRQGGGVAATRARGQREVKAPARTPHRAPVTHVDHTVEDMDLDAIDDEINRMEAELSYAE